MLHNVADLAILAVFHRDLPPATHGPSHIPICAHPSIEFTASRNCHILLVDSVALQTLGTVHLLDAYAFIGRTPTDTISSRNAYSPTALQRHQFLAVECTVCLDEIRSRQIRLLKPARQLTIIGQQLRGQTIVT